jgi:excisionase family DNA binding protein
MSRTAKRLDATPVQDNLHSVSQPEPLLLKKKQVAAALNVSERQVGYLLARRLLKQVKIGRSTRVRATDLAAYVASLRVTP